MKNNEALLREYTVKYKFNFYDISSHNYLEPDIVCRSMYWYKDKFGNIIKAKDLYEALENAQSEYYLLGDYSGYLLEDYQEKSVSIKGNIWNVGNGIIDTVASFIKVKFINYKQLVKVFYENSFAYWILFPASKDIYNRWLSNCTYKIYDNFSKIMIF
jgi:hypothetical protein